MIPANYVEKVYAGFFGKNVGIRLGAPVESVIWTYERIRAIFGDEIHGYLREYKDFGADDDANGPAYYFRTLEENDDPSMQDFGTAWVDYAREGKGFFWWGGIGTSNSHTVYAMLRQGQVVPIAKEVLQGAFPKSESIGGQIFVDTIGLCLPGQPARAAEIAERLARVAHYDESVYGGQFMAAAVAAAFVCTDVREVIEQALATIPADSDYTRVTRAVLDFYKQQPGDWRACFAMLEKEWGYDRYSGICPMIPNAGVCILALVYGAGDFNKTVEIATMCGWDTDCNAGNVGTILGVMRGMEGIDDVYVKPFHDTAILSGVSGTLNNCDLPSFAREVALRGYQLAGETPPQALCVPPQDLFYDFELPKSTHGFRVSDPFILQIENRECGAHGGKRALQVTFNRLQKGNHAKLFFKPFHTRADFNDGRYSPVFSPKVCPGQVMSLWLYREQWTGAMPVQVAPYVRTAFTQREIVGEWMVTENEAWTEIIYQIPDVQGEIIDECGLMVMSSSVNGAEFESRDLGRFFLDDVRVSGPAKYTIDMEKSMLELGCWTPFSHDRGDWRKEGAELRVTSPVSTTSFTGNYFDTDYRITCDVQVEEGGSGCLLLRGLGTVRHVLAGLLPGGKAGVLVAHVGYSPLAVVDFAWELGRKYTLCAQAQADEITLWIDGQEVVRAKGIPYGHGMVGMGLSEAGACAFSGMSIETGSVR